MPEVQQPEIKDFVKDVIEHNDENQDYILDKQEKAQIKKDLVELRKRAKGDEKMQQAVYLAIEDVLMEEDYQGVEGDTIREWVYEPEVADEKIRQTVIKSGESLIASIGAFSDELSGAVKEMSDRGFTDFITPSNMPSAIASIFTENGKSDMEMELEEVQELYEKQSYGVKQSLELAIAKIKRGADLDDTLNSIGNTPEGRFLRRISSGENPAQAKARYLLEKGREIKRSTSTEKGAEYANALFVAASQSGFPDIAAQAQSELPQGFAKVRLDYLKPFADKWLRPHQLAMYATGAAVLARLGATALTMESAVKVGAGATALGAVACESGSGGETPDEEQQEQQEQNDDTENNETDTGEEKPEEEDTDTETNEENETLEEPAAPELDDAGPIIVEQDNPVATISGILPTPDITDIVEYRLNGGDWNQWVEPEDGVFSFNVNGPTTVELRAVNEDENSDAEAVSDIVSVEIQLNEETDTDTGEPEQPEEPEEPTDTDTGEPEQPEEPTDTDTGEPEEPVDTEEVDETPPEEPVLEFESISLPMTSESFNINVTVPTDAQKVKIYRLGEGDTLIPVNETLTEGATSLALTIPHESGTNANYIFKTVDEHENESAGVTLEANIEAPEISGLGIDCSIHGGYCTTGETYPVSWNFENAISFDTQLELISGSTTLGVVEPASGILTGNNKMINYTLGNSGPATVRLTVTTYGPGGDASQSIDINYY